MERVSTRLEARDWRMIVAFGLPSLASGLFLPLSLVYFTVLTDIPLGQLGVIVSASVLVTIPLPLLTGWLVDRFGASGVVTTALLVQAAGFAGFTVARTAWTVFAVSAVMSIGNRVYWSSIFTAIAAHSDATRTHPHDWWYAAANVSRTVGITAGGLITGVIISVGSDAAYIGVAASAALLLVVAAVVLPRAPRSADAGPPSLPELISAVRDLPYAAYVLLNGVLALSILFLGASLPTTIRSHFEGPGWLTSVLLAANALLVAGLGLRAAAWTSSRPRARSLGIAAAWWTLAYGLIAVGTSLPLWWAVIPLAVAVVGIASGEALHAPVSMAWATDAAPEGARGRYLALFQYAWLIAEISAPALFTSLFVKEAWLPFATVAVLNVLAALALPSVSRALARRHI